MMIIIKNFNDNEEEKEDYDDDDDSHHNDKYLRMIQKAVLNLVSYRTRYHLLHQVT